MSLIPPSASNRYQVTDDHDVDAETWNEVHGSLADRLSAVETAAAGFEDAVSNAAIAAAQALLANAVVPQIENVQDLLAAIETAISLAEDRLQALQTGGVVATNVTLSAIAGLTSTNVQAAFAEVVGLLAAEVTARNSAIAAETTARNAAIAVIQSTIGDTVTQLRKDLLLTGLQAAASYGDRLNLSAGIIDPYSDASDITLADAALDGTSKLVAFKRPPFMAASGWNLITGSGYNAYGYNNNNSLSNVIGILSTAGGSFYGSYVNFGNAVGAVASFVVERPTVLFPIRAMEIIADAGDAGSWLVQVTNEANTVVFGQATISPNTGYGSVVTVDFATQCNERRVRIAVTKQSGTNSMNMRSLRLLGAKTADHSPAPLSATGFGGTSVLSYVLGANANLAGSTVGTSGSPNEVNISFASARLLSRIGLFGLAGYNSTLTFDLSGSNDGVTYTGISTGFNPFLSEATLGGMFDLVLPETTLAYSRYRLTRTAGGTSLSFLSLHLFDKGNAAGQITSSAFATEAAPSKLRLGAQVKRYNGGPLSDLLFDVSRDNGTTWSPVTVTKTGDQADGFEFVEGIVDVTGQPVGSNARYRIRSQNNITADIGGAVLQWG